ncbi:hypothetical protein D6D01_10423, partial [Aureobasidium pullulans]
MHLDTLVLLAIAGLSLASPAPQQLDIKYMQGAPAVQNSPPLNGIPAQTATLIASVEVFTAATASSTVAPTAAVQVRDVAKRHVIVGIENSIALATSNAVSIVANVAALAIRVVAHDVIVTAVAVPVYLICFFTFGIACPSTAGGSPSATATASVSKVGTSTVTVATITTTGSSAYTPYYPATSTITRLVTRTVSTGAVCLTAVEAGTYCGFFNPKDPYGYGPVPTPNTVSAFHAYKPFHSMASAAPTVVSVSAVSSTASNPPMTFKDLSASSSANSYLGLYTLESYDVAECAAICDKNPTNNDSTAPTVWGYNCPNPALMTSYKCTLWGSALSASTATNTGGWRSAFQVAITASNGYDKTNATIPETPSNSPKNCGHKAMNSPQNWMGSRFFPGPFNPQLCGNFAIAQNYQNKAAAKATGKNYYQPYNMFNAYYLHKNGLPWGTYCALYDVDLVVNYANYAGATLTSDAF